jgi:peptidoglycan/LPS O-acetylase OafA/YrhL
LKSSSTLETLPPSLKLAHRADIDGLRGVAVLLVVFYHLGMRGFSGGYVGVDVFFVISGYLISGIILRENAAGVFSFAAFYERRFRRIIPALLAMLLVVTLLAHQFLFPPELEDYGGTLVATLLSVSNVLFCRTTDYFDIGNQARPLLHTWSLGVEEQFYLVLPIFLVAMSRWWRRGLNPAIWTLTAASFCATCWALSRNYDEIGFFLAPLRAWELLLGTILSQQNLRSIKSQWMLNCASVLGITLILAPAVLYDPYTTFPGMAALPPCLGAVLLIACGEMGPTLAGKLLSWRPVSALGVISYSLYLLHWPIHVFQKDTEFLVSESRHPHAVAPVVLTVSLIAAALSWRFIETPFLRGGLQPRRRLFAICVPAFLVLMGAGLLFVKYSGGAIPYVPSSTESVRYANFQLHHAEPHAGQCFVMELDYASFTPSTCLAADPERKQLLLIGDSHAYSLYEGLSTVFPELNISLATMAGCRPLVTYRPWMRPDCVKMNHFIFGDYLLHHHVDGVLVAGRWSEWAATDLEETIAWIKSHGMEPIVFGPSPEYDMSMLRLVAISERNHDPDVFLRHRVTQPDRLDRKFSVLVRDVWKVRYISFYEDVCGVDPGTLQVDAASECPLYATPTAPMLKDDNHLSPQGSIFFAQAIKARKQLP